MLGSDQCLGRYRSTDRESHDQISPNIRKSFDGTDGNDYYRYE